MSDHVRSRHIAAQNAAFVRSLHLPVDQAPQSLDCDNHHLHGRSSLAAFDGFPCRSCFDARKNKLSIYFAPDCNGRQRAAIALFTLKQNAGV